MVRWKNRTDEDKKRINAEQSGFPLAEQLEEKIKSIPEYKRAKYIQEWIDYHRNSGMYDKELLDEIWGHLYHAQKMNNVLSLPYFKNGTRTQDFINFALMIIHKDSHWPDEMKKQMRQTLSELMGPEVTFDPEGLPDDYTPFWKKKPEDFKRDPMRNYNDREAEKPPTLSPTLKINEGDDVKINGEKVEGPAELIGINTETGKPILDDWKDSHLDRGNYNIEPPEPEIDDWEAKMNQSIRKKHQLTFKHCRKCGVETNFNQEGICTRCGYDSTTKKKKIRRVRE